MNKVKYYVKLSSDLQLSIVGVDLLSTKSSFLQETAATLYTPIFQLVDRIQGNLKYD